MKTWIRHVTMRLDMHREELQQRYMFFTTKDVQLACGKSFHEFKSAASEYQKDNWITYYKSQKNIKKNEKT